MTTGLESIYVPNVSEFLERNNVPIAPAIRANGFLFLSGAPPIDPDTGELVKGDVITQTEVIMRQIQATLKAAGSSLDKVVKVTVYCSNSAYFKVINDVYVKYFGDHKPTRTFVTVASWPMEFDVEIECQALA
ncbi:RidA family protein [Oceanicella sp. SM1341]|uniref:RidA family protein n=1 Tax=Oceanicella sp. SM1341 TaxID=1548889 RepID=UPI000E4A2E0A|nr:Rid family hydrolase [Oceanicella sp. SM1341]